MTYTITASPVGETGLLGAVKYYSPDGWEEPTFYGFLEFTTGNAYASVYARFKGLPWGTAVDGTFVPCSSGS